MSVVLSRENLAQAVIRELQRMIKDGEFEPGEQLPPHESLAQMFGVSRPTVREAIQALRLAGVVEIHPGRGSFVCKDPEQRLRSARATWLMIKEIDTPQLTEARFVVERALATFASQRATSDQIRQMEEAVKGMCNSLEDAEQFAFHDVDFHLAIAEAAGNQLLAQIYRMLRDLSQDTAEEWAMIPGVRADTARLHGSVFRAIKDGDMAAIADAIDAWAEYREPHSKQLLNGNTRTRHRPD